LPPPARLAITWSMGWHRVCRDVPEGELILVSYGEQVVVALAFPADYYFPEMTFMDARTFDILPLPTHWMKLPEPPQAETSSRPGAPVSRRAA
jgi:hypothetical protein